MSLKVAKITHNFFDLLTGKLFINSKNIDKIFSNNSKIIGTYSNDIIEKEDFKNYLNKIYEDDVYLDNIYNSMYKVSDKSYVNNCYVRWLSKSKPVFKNRITLLYTYNNDIKDYKIDLVHSSKLPFDE
jgi:hypothetical protein